MFQFSAGILKPDQITTSSPEESHLVPWKKLGCHSTSSNDEVVRSSDAVIWAVKPQVFPDAAKATSTKGCDRKFHISIMAGLPLDKFKDTLMTCGSEEFGTARVMPNVGMKVGAGCSVYTIGIGTSESEKTLLQNLLSTNGLAYEVPEAQINAYCGLFGSGIGFMFVILEAMSDAAVSMGIPRDLSLRIAAQTMKGAAELSLDEKEQLHPAILKDIVCSPGGTTIAGVTEMEKYGVRAGIISAIVAATKRGEELGKK